MSPVPLRRVFPWHPDAAEGERFSAAFVPGGQGGNRFDLPGVARGVIYLAESEEHAVAEKIQAYRNLPAPLSNDDLTEWGQGLALVSATLVPEVWRHLADLCEPATLRDLGITAETPALRNRERTRQLAVDLYAREYLGLRW